MNPSPTIAAIHIEPPARPPLRLWPGVAAAVVLGVARFVIPSLFPNSAGIGLLGGMGAALIIVVWWLFFSRAPWLERLGALVLMGLGVVVTARLVHPSIATGMMGMMFPFVSIPILTLVLVAWAAATRRSPTRTRLAALAVLLALACGAFTLLRTSGITADGGSDLHWRWTETPEQRLLAQTASKHSAPAPTPLIAAVTNAAHWPGFRGPDRDGVAHGVRIDTNWSRLPPVQLWHRPVGPGWSSFAVQGDVFFTQEQRGEDEIVACYRVMTGEPVWEHRDPVRFWESNSGAGPRATPTLSGGRVYTLGGKGTINALDAVTGAVLWSRDLASDANRKVPMWGFAASPLVEGEVVIVAAEGTLAGYDISTGQPRWTGPAHGGGYSSPHRVVMDGGTQVLLMSSAGVTSVEPDKGTVLWEHAWEGTTIVQPAVLAGGDLLVSTSGPTGGLGLRRLTCTHGDGGWTVEERWTSRGLKSYFNDFVVHEGHAYGFDGATLACVELQDGVRKWKGGRYGGGQLLLLADQGLLLVLSEEGAVALVPAMPDKFRELGRFQAIEGKTWNHPAMAGDTLLVRNSEKMAAFRLSQAGQ